MVIALLISKLVQLTQAPFVIFCGNCVKRILENFKVHVIWDNARYHRNAEVTEFAKALGITLHYLPYSPNLNPVERIWKLMHESVRYNQYYGKFSEFTDATLGFFKGIGRKKCILRERVTVIFRFYIHPCSHLEV